VTTGQAPTAGRFSYHAPVRPILKADGVTGLRMVDCMCGRNAPVASACSWFGWHVFTGDLEGTPFNSSLDLLNLSHRKVVEDRVWVADAYFWAMECTTLSQARAIPVEGMNVLPMRGEEHVRGLPELAEPKRKKDRLKCEQHNDIIDWGTALMHTCVLCGKGAGEENPRGSWLWRFPEQKSFK
jgi:hypothetical protein